MSELRLRLKECRKGHKFITRWKDINGKLSIAIKWTVLASGPKTMTLKHGRFGEIKPDRVRAAYLDWETLFQDCKLEICID